MKSPTRNITQRTPSSLFEATPFSRAEERRLFGRLAALRRQADELQGGPAAGSASTRAADLAAIRDEATQLRNRIMEANQRLVVSIARRFAHRSMPLEELVGEAQLPLMRAVELFDPSRGYCFSTYATNAIRNHFYRLLSRTARRGERTVPMSSTQVDPPAPVCEDSERGEADAARQKSMLVRLLGDLTNREKLIVAARFGLDGFERPHTFQEIGREVRLSKERVRVIAHAALEKLRDAAQRAGLERTAV